MNNLLTDTITTAADTTLGEARVQDALERGGRIVVFEAANDADDTYFVTVALDGVRYERRVSVDFLAAALQQ